VQLNLWKQTNFYILFYRLLEIIIMRYCKIIDVFIITFLFIPALCAMEYNHIEYNHTDKVKKILSSGVPLKTFDNFCGVSYLFAAIIHIEQFSDKNGEVVDFINLLLDYGANIEEQWMNKTPLYWAVQFGQYSTVELLLARNAKLFYSDTWGSLLHAALWLAGSNTVSIIELLLVHRVDMYQKNFLGETPIEYAISRKEMYSRELERPKYNFPTLDYKYMISILDCCIELLKKEEEIKRNTCTICLEFKASLPWTSLLCGHRFCNDCLMELFHVAWQNQIEFSHQLCPHRDCNQEWQEADVRAFSGNNKEILQKFHTMKLLNYMRQSLHLRTCPKPDCIFMYDIEGAQPRLIKCPNLNCRANFCSHCQASHNPQIITCQEIIIIASMSEGELEQESNAWKASHQTKPCPSCGINIQKEGGCEHMKCRKCGQKFNW
jgi:hypothetical protein